MDLKALIGIAIQGSLLLLVLAVGLRATPADTLYVLRRPGLLIRSLVAIDVVVPLLAAVFVTVLPLTPMVKAGIVFMAVSPLPPFVPGKALKFGGDVSYICGLLVAVSLLSVVTVPALLAIFSALFRVELSVAPAALARVVAISVLLPLGMGMTVHGLAADFAMRSASKVSAVANVVMTLVLVPVLIAAWPAIWQLVGSWSVLAIAALATLALAAGHLLGGPDPEHRTTLAFATATRHPGIALLIAHSNVEGARLSASVLLFVLASLLAAVPYQVWCKRRLRQQSRAEAFAESHPAFERTR
jgi:bile acid:Na+ symporter, BASS family